MVHVHTVCACVNISVNFSVKLSLVTTSEHVAWARIYVCARLTGMSGENHTDTETKIKPHEEPADSWFSKD